MLWVEDNEMTHRIRNTSERRDWRYSQIPVEFVRTYSDISTISCALNLLSYCVINSDCLAEEKRIFVYFVYTEEHGCDKQQETQEQNDYTVHVLNYQQDRQCTHNVTLRHVRAFVLPSLQEKRNSYYIFWACICRLSHPAYNAHAPYCHLYRAPVYNIFPRYLINGTILE